MFVEKKALSYAPRLQIKLLSYIRVLEKGHWPTMPLPEHILHNFFAFSLVFQRMNGTENEDDF